MGAHEEVNEDTVYTCTGRPKKQDIEQILEWLLNNDFGSAYNSLTKLKSEKGLALQDIIESVHEYVHKIDFPAEIRIFILDKIAEIEERLAAGTSEKLQTSSLVSIFQQAKNMVAASV